MERAGCLGYFLLATDSPKRPTRPLRMDKMRRTPTRDLPTADLLRHEPDDKTPLAPHSECGPSMPRVTRALVKRGGLDTSYRVKISVTLVDT